MADDTQSPTSEEPGETDEAIWKEMIAKENGEEASSTEPAPADGTPSDPPDAEVADREDKPAPAEEEAKSAKPAAPAEEEDPWKDAPEALRTAHEEQVERNRKLEARLHSETGRVSALTKKVRAMTAPPAPQPQQAASPSQPDQPAPEAGASNDGTPEPPNDLNKIAAEYPELKPLLDEVQSGRVQIDQLTRAQADEFEAFQERELDKFKQLQPDGMQVLNQNRDKLTAWLEDQPKRVYDTFETNRQYIVDADAAGELVSNFKAFLAAGEGDPNPNPKPLDTKRQKQIEGAQGPAARGRNPVTSGLPDNASDEEIWEDMRRKDEAAARRQQV
ncbi:MAG: hypothetical protein AAGF22_12260 [Pseudomonadota bacterium]